jgi:hypothetical protein
MHDVNDILSVDTSAVVPGLNDQGVVVGEHRKHLKSFSMINHNMTVVMSKRNKRNIWQMSILWSHSWLLATLQMCLVCLTASHWIVQSCILMCHWLPNQASHHSLHSEEKVHTENQLQFT